jgi:hypothetical protein
VTVLYAKCYTVQFNSHSTRIEASLDYRLSSEPSPLHYFSLTYFRTIRDLSLLVLWKLSQSIWLLWFPVQEFPHLNLWEHRYFPILIDLLFTVLRRHSIIGYPRSRPPTLLFINIFSYYQRPLSSSTLKPVPINMIIMVSSSGISSFEPLGILLFPNINRFIIHSMQ